MVLFPNMFAEQLIKELVHQGGRYFCIAPGKRCAPLSHAVSKHPLAEVVIHYDERGAAFHALGYAKGKGLPAAVIVSSGTALANVYPAVVEAYYSRVPLIILAGDRPYELRDVGANQTINQVKFFGSFI